MKKLYQNKIENIIQQLTWCWLTWSISLSHSKLVLPPSFFTLMSNTAGRASSILMDTQYSVAILNKICRSCCSWECTCSMTSVCAACWTRHWCFVRLRRMWNISQTQTQKGSHEHQLCVSSWQRGWSLPSHRQVPTHKTLAFSFLCTATKSCQ